MCSSCLRLWADDSNILERNITSSDVEFLEGRDFKENSSAKTSRKIKDKLENAHASIDSNARHVPVLTLTTPDLSGLKHKADCDNVDMNDSDIMSVLDQIIDKELTLSQHGGPCK